MHEQSSFSSFNQPFLAEPEDLITSHARIRMGQPGIQPEVIELVLKYGRKTHSRRAWYYVIGQKEIKRFGDMCAALKELDGMHVVMDDDRTNILTVYRNHDLRRIRPAKRKHRHLH